MDAAVTPTNFASGANSSTSRNRDPLGVPERSGSGQELPVLSASWHRVDDHLVTVLEDEDDGLEEARLDVESES